MAKTNDADFVITSLKAFSAEQMRRLALDIQAGLVEDTPVDTGWARANWVPSIGDPFTGLAGERGAVSEAEQSAGTAEVVGYDTLDSGPIFLTNNVPYILPLNEGHSQQAPLGFVQARIARSLQEFEA